MKHAIMWTDGSCDGNGSSLATGAAAYVIVPSGTNADIVREGFNVNKRPEYPVTVNVCEYAAVRAGLERAVKLGVTHIEVRSDSKLVVNQLNGEWKINYLWLKELNAEIHRTAKHFVECKFVWVPREDNAEADRIAYATLSGRPWQEFTLSQARDAAIRTVEDAEKERRNAAIRGYNSDIPHCATCTCAHGEEEK